MILNIPGRLEDTVVANFAEGSALFCKLRDESGEGARTWPNGELLGCATYRVSYNGKVWCGDEHEAELCYNPYDKTV